MNGQSTARGRVDNGWSVHLAEAAVVQADVIRAAAGSVPDLGAVRAAGVLSGRLGTTVTGDGVEELARGGLIPVTGSYKNYPLYDGRALGSFTDTAAVTEACRSGRLRTVAQATAYLRIRRSDLNRLIRARILKPAKHVRGPWDRRGTFSVSLYRTGDLDAFLARADIDWQKVRSTPPGRRSPLAELAEAETVLAALAAIGEGRRR